MERVGYKAWTRQGPCVRPARHSIQMPSQSSTSPTHTSNPTFPATPPSGLEHDSEMASMLPITLRALRSRSAAPLLRATFTTSTRTAAEKTPANDPVQRDAKPNVSETNAMPTSSEGSFDKVLQESRAKGEELRTQQAPNYKGIWSRSQQPREKAMSGPRFEQSIMEDQVRRAGRLFCRVGGNMERNVWLMIE